MKTVVHRLPKKIVRAGFQCRAEQGRALKIVHGIYTRDGVR